MSREEECIVQILREFKKSWVLGRTCDSRKPRGLILQ